MNRCFYWFRNIAIIFVSFSSTAIWADFRGFRFGAQFEDIVKAEKAAFVETAATTVVYKDAILGFETFVSFHFSPENDQLVAGSYNFNTVGHDINEIIDHYMEVVDIMNRKYGPTLSDGIKWWSQGNRENTDIVSAFRFAEASFSNEWWGPGVQVSLILKNELNTRGEITYRIVYRPGRNYNRLEDLAKF